MYQNCKPKNTFINYKFCLLKLRFYQKLLIVFNNTQIIFTKFLLRYSAVYQNNI